MSIRKRYGKHIDQEEIECQLKEYGWRAQLITVSTTKLEERMREMSDANYEMAWELLKNIIEQFGESHAFIAQSTAENSSKHHQAIGREYMAGLILEEMEHMEEGIANPMRGDEADE